MAHLCPDPVCGGTMAILPGTEEDDDVMNCDACNLAFKETELDSGKAYSYYP